MGLAPEKASRIRQALEDSQWVCPDPWSYDVINAEEIRTWDQ